MVNTSTILLVTTYLAPRRYLVFTRLTRALGVRMLLRVRSGRRLSRLGPFISVLKIGGHGLKAFRASIRGSFHLTGTVRAITHREGLSPLLMSRDNVSAAAAMSGLERTNFRKFLVKRAFVGASMPNSALTRFVKELS